MVWFGVKGDDAQPLFSLKSLGTVCWARSANGYIWLADLNDEIFSNEWWWDADDSDDDVARNIDAGDDAEQVDWLKGAIKIQRTERCRKVDVDDDAGDETDNDDAGRAGEQLEQSGGANLAKWIQHVR